MAVEIDSNTGLPELPEGHFWRVSTDDCGEVKIAIRKHRKLWWSKRIIGGYVRHGEDHRHILSLSNEALTPAAIFATAEDCLEAWRERDAKRVRYETNRKLLGSYPPKKLEGV